MNWLGGVAEMNAIVVCVAVIETNKFLKPAAIFPCHKSRHKSAGKMHFPYVACSITCLVEDLPQENRVGLDSFVTAAGSVCMAVSAGHKGPTRGCANRRARIRLLEKHPLLCNPVQIGSFQIRMARRAKTIRTHLIHVDNQDVWTVLVHENLCLTIPVPPSKVQVVNIAGQQLALLRGIAAAPTSPGKWLNPPSAITLAIVALRDMTG